MRRLLSNGLTVTCAALGMVAAAILGAEDARSQGKQVNVYNWSDYIDPQVLADFTKETGISVKYDTFDSNDVLETKLLAGKTGYDIVVPTAYFLERQIKAGVFQPLDKKRLPNLIHVWPEIGNRLAVYDPDNRHAVNYMWGTTGIGYNEDKIKERMADAPVNSWDLIFKPEIVSKFKDCGIFLLDAPDDIIPIALLYLGLNPNSKDPADLEKAGELLQKIRPNIQKFHSSEFINALANGDICIAVGYSGDILQARTRATEAKNGVKVGYKIPKEGAQMWFDQMAIPADAKHVAEAHEFLNYMLKPEVIAKASNYVNYANGNLASQQFINKEILEDTSIFPDEATLKRLFVKDPYDAKTQRAVTRIWTKVVTGQ